MVKQMLNLLGNTSGSFIEIVMANTTLTDLDYIDGIAFFCQSVDLLVFTLKNFDEIVGKIGRRLSWPQAKAMAIFRN